MSQNTPQPQRPSSLQIITWSVIAVVIFCMFYFLFFGPSNPAPDNNGRVPNSNTLIMQIGEPKNHEWASGWECQEEIKTGNLLNCEERAIDATYMYFSDYNSFSCSAIGAGWESSRETYFYDSSMNEQEYFTLCKKYDIVCEEETKCIKRIWVENRVEGGA